ncbi:UNVERIFIED_CONTAM: hypothetical protein RMT77_003115 [Armadillidium vulgare]
MAISKGQSWPDILEKIRSHGVRVVWILFGFWIVINIIVANKKSASFINSIQGGLSRDKRFIFMDNQRRLSLPTGSILALSGVLSLPFLGNLPIGYGSGLTVAVPLTVKFDDLGMTSPDNRFGYFDFGNMTGYFGIPSLNMSALRPPSFLDPGNFPDRFQNNLQYALINREKRSTWKAYPGVNYAGGDREMIYQIVEDVLSSFTLDGKACVMRAICEMHEVPLINYGFLGEAFKLLLSPSLAAFAEHRLGFYVKAEKDGKEKKDCTYYHQFCKYSIFSRETLQEREHPLPDNVTDIGLDNSLSNITNSSDAHHRQKRFFMFGPSQRLFFPPDTAVVGTPTLNLPFMRDLPDGYHSQLSYSAPFTFDFGGLGLTSILNTFGQIPFLKRRRKRSLYDTFGGIHYSGGDREMMYAVIADALDKIGHNGEACLLRVICEIHEMPLQNHGLFGELFHLFLTPSLAPQARKRLGNFVKAEKLGRNCGDCGIYFSLCPRSIFTNPSAGIRFSNATELNECKLRHSTKHTQESMNLGEKF